MDAANQRAHDNTMTLLGELCDGDRAAHFDGAYRRQTIIPDTERDDLITLFERHAERGPDDELYIRVETAADLVVDRG